MSERGILDSLGKSWEEDPDQFVGRVSQEEIGAAQSELKVSFSEPYVGFLQRFGGGIVGSKLVYGLRKHFMMDDRLWSVVDNTRHFRDEGKWPGTEGTYVVSDDGRGNPFCVDPDGAVWLVDHDAGFEKVKVANDFEEFLYRLHHDTLFGD